MTAGRTRESFQEHYGSFSVVAGGSDGIGAAFARDLAGRGLNVVLIARRKDPLETAAEELRRDFPVEVRTLQADLTEPDIAERVAAATADLDVGLLVYNAGSSRRARKLLDLPASEAELLLDLNCRGPLLLAHHFGTRLRERGRGGIVLMSSVACVAGSAYQASYCASKAFVTVLAEALWHELAPEGVDVLSVIAGKTRTETMRLHAEVPFDDGMAPSEVAIGALDHLGRGPTFVPGEPNQRVVRAMWPAPRVGLVNALSRGCAELFGLAHTQVEGVEFDAEPDSG